MIEIHPRRPPAPTEENKNRRTRRPRNGERTLAMIQYEHDEKKPFIHASDIAGSAWLRGSDEYKKQCESLRSSAFRVARGRKKAASADKKKAEEHITAQKIRDTLTIDEFNWAIEQINRVCDLHEAHLAQGNNNVHFYFDGDTGKLIERNLDLEPPPEFPESHTVQDHQTSQEVQGEPQNVAVDEEPKVHQASQNEPPAPLKDSTKRKNGALKRVMPLKLIALCTLGCLVIGLFFCLKLMHGNLNYPIKEESVEVFLQESSLTPDGNSDAIYQSSAIEFEQQLNGITTPDIPFIHRKAIRLINVLHGGVPVLALFNSDNSAAVSTSQFSIVFPP